MAASRSAPGAWTGGGLVVASRNDVARLAGVSGATVSYVLNDAPGASISAGTRKTVLAAAARLGYRPSMAGRALKDGRLRQIGVLGPSGDTLFLPYHEGILRGVWRALSQEGCRLVLDSVDAKGRISFVDERIVDGFVTLSIPPASFPSSVRRFIRQKRIPVAMVGGGSWARDFHSVDIDNGALGRAAAALLADRGHRRFLVFGANPDSVPAVQRRKGFFEGLAIRGLRVPASHVMNTQSVDPSEACDAAKAFFRRDRGITAAFCYNDLVAVGLMRAAWEMGMTLPHDLSIVGVDAMPMAQALPLKLTSFRQPLEQMGRQAAHMVLARPGRPVHVCLPFELVEGDTVLDRRHLVNPH